MSQHKANGFIPNSFQTPNILVDRLMPLLLDNELRVTLFGYRHIFGWFDNRIERATTLSYSNFETGYRGQPGCGLTRPQISTALKSVSEFGVLKKVGTPTKDGQRWRPPESEDEIDWKALEARADKRRKTSQKQTAAATRASQKKRHEEQKQDSKTSPDRPSESPSDSTSNILLPGTFNVPFRSTLNIPPLSTLNVLEIGTLDVPLSYIKKRSNKTDQDQTHSSTTESSESPISPTSQDDVDDEILKLIQPEIQKLLLPQSDQAALLALGPVQALAIAWSAQGDHVRNPGGLAKHLMGNGGPPDEQIARAQAAVELRTLDGDQIDHHLRHRAGTASSNPEEPPPNWKYFQLGDAPSPELPDEAPHESLNFKHRDRTVWEAYKAALAELEWDPRVMTHERAMYADLRLARYEAETQTLIVTGDPVAAGGLAQRISSQLGLDITMEFEAREETA